MVIEGRAGKRQKRKNDACESMFGERGTQRGEDIPAQEHPAAFSAWLVCHLVIAIGSWLAQGPLHPMVPLPPCPDFSQFLFLLPHKLLLRVRHIR